MIRVFRKGKVLSDDIRESDEEMRVERVVPTVNIRYHHELYPDLEECYIQEDGDFVDLRSAKKVELKAGEFALIDLGVSVELPEGYWGQFVPRSSLFKNHGLLQTNSFAVIDNSYCGDNDFWKMPVYATRDTVIEENERICQFTIVEKQTFKLGKKDKLEGKDRGGFGHSGRK